jgi:hypothetical protein
MKVGLHWTSCCHLPSSSALLRLHSSLLVLSLIEQVDGYSISITKNCIYGMTNILMILMDKMSQIKCNNFVLTIYVREIIFIAR